MDRGHASFAHASFFFKCIVLYVTSSYLHQKQKLMPKYAINKGIQSLIFEKAGL